MEKKCVFNSNKICNDCKECELCELDRKKICNNCGKCLELEGYDVRAIKIDEVFEKDEDSSKDIFDEKVDLEAFSDFDLEEEYDDCDCIDCETDYDFKDEEGEYLDVFDNEEGISYIDDIDEIRELIESGEDLPETFPGLIAFNKYVKKEKK